MQGIDPKKGAFVDWLRVGKLFVDLVGEGIERVRKQKDNTRRLPKARQVTKSDFYTSADVLMQKWYEESIQTYFPTIPLVGEEKTGYVPPRNSAKNCFITIDGIDGTRNFAEKKKYGVGTQLALVFNGKVLAACIGDVWTGEIFGFYPGTQPFLIRGSNRQSLAKFNQSKVSLANSPALMRHDTKLFEQPICRLLESGLVSKNHLVGFGGIGVSMGLLWKSRVGMFVLKKSKEAPWDICPAYGLSQQLDIVFLRPSSDGKQLVFWEPLYSDKIYERPFTILATPRNRLPEIQAALAKL